MRDYVQYHKTEEYGPASTSAPIYICTNKHKPEVVGSRVWLFSGEGRPRRYFLSAMFIADRFFPMPDPDFFFRVDGEEGRRFAPPIEVTDYPWFYELRRQQGNFAFGLNELNERFLPYLEDLIVNLNGS
jgi:hypothetical protein